MSFLNIGEVYITESSCPSMSCDESGFKIGKTLQGAEKRKKQLQTGSCNELVTYRILKGYTKLENALHKHFADKLIINGSSREWFDITKEEIDNIVVDSNGNIHTGHTCIEPCKCQISDKILIDKPPLVKQSVIYNFVNKTIDETLKMADLKCLTCQKIFTRMYDYTRHVNKKIPCGAPDPTCHKCNNTFASASKLKKHLQRKTPCDPIATDGNNPALVLTMANNENRCRYCGKDFSTKSSLTRHTKNTCNIDNNIKLIIDRMTEDNARREAKRDEFFLSKIEELTKWNI
jgi:uncharacterized C2H2 Zn-finger protein